MLNAAIVGMGKWGQTLVNSVQGSNEAGIRFVAGCTGRPERAAAWAAEKGIRVLPDFDAVLADPAVQAVAIASPHQMHAAQVMAAARAGKHVFVEKPFTMTKASAEAGIASVQANCSADERYERKVAANGKFHFNLKAANHQVIGSSQMYASQASSEGGIASVKTNGCTTTVKDNT